MVFELLLFTAVGLVATSLYFAVAFALEARMSLLWTIFWAFWISLPASYFLQRWFVFVDAAPHMSAAPKFVVIQLVGLAANQVLAGTIAVAIAARSPFARRTILGLAYLAAALATYVAAKFWAFAG